MNKLKIAITGANGYIGHQCCRHFARQGHNIIALARTAVTDYEWHRFSLSEANNLSILEDCDVLIHCAYDFSATNFVKAKKINVDGTIDLFQQAQRAEVAKIIYISSVSSAANARSNYGRIKYALEEIALQRNILVVKPGLVFNSNLAVENGGMMRSLVRLVNYLPIIPMAGRGQQIFYPCHMSDLLDLLSTLLENSTPLPSVTVAASEQTITFAQIIQIIAQLQHKKAVTLPFPPAAIYWSLKLAEAVHLNFGLRSDSLHYLWRNHHELDFANTRKLGVNFRPFSLTTTT